MALDDNALIALAEQKTYLNITVADHDGILEILINSLSDYFDRETNRNLKEATYTDLYIDGNGKKELWLPNYPVGSIASLKEDDETLTEGEDNDYYAYLDTGRLVRIGTNWLEGYKTIKITYTAGLATIPDDLKLAMFKQIAYEFQKYQTKDWGESSRSFPDGSITKFREIDLLEDVKRIISGYKRFVL